MKKPVPCGTGPKPPRGDIFSWNDLAIVFAKGILVQNLKLGATVHHAPAL
jgi:hypothetical protein